MSVQTAPAFTLGYRPALDGFRGIAVLLVVLHHLRIPFPTGGFLGVDIFFVLSGFLITSLLCEEKARFGSIKFSYFYQRRALRLMPALVLVIGAVMLASVVLGPKSKIEDNGKASLAALFYATNWLTAFQLIPWSPLSHTWSLSSEEQFYLVWPIVLWALLAMKTGPRAILGLVAASIVALTLYRGWLWHRHHSSIRVYYSLDTHADGLITGCLLALLFAFGTVGGKSRFGPWGWPSLVVILAAASFGTTDSSWVWYGGLSAVNVTAALVIGAVIADADGSLAKALRWEPLAWLGRLSYGIFLWHYPIFLQVEKMLGARGRHLSIPAALAATAVASTASYYLVEKPLLRLKKHRTAEAGATLAKS